MFGFLKKKKKKVYDKWFLLILSTIVVCLGIGNELLKGTSALDVVPANLAFDDMSFYMCVVDAYNSENDTDLEYNVSLTDEQLLTIKNLNCSVIGNGLDKVDKIKSTKGIEKLTSLVEIQLVEHEISSINLFNNTNLKYIQLKNNKLTAIDVSNNKKLILLDVSENYLTSIDVSNNINLQQLSVNNNYLNELDLTSNNDLKYVFSMYNNFSKTINIYKGESLTIDSVENVIKLPIKMSYNLFNWIIWDYDESNIISVDNNVVEALNGGTIDIYGGIDYDDTTNIGEDIGYFLIDNTINVIDISSEEYLINKDENFVYVGVGEIDINKINVVDFNLIKESNKLKILSKEEKIINELEILGVNFGNLNITDNVINITSEFSYENFISNIVKSDKLSYKIVNSNNEAIDTGNLLGGEKVEIYYGDILLEIYEIRVIDENLT